MGAIRMASSPVRFLGYSCVLLSCFVLEGCGIYAVNHEANRYKDDVSATTKSDLLECKSNAASPHPLDHRLPGAAGPDCYSAFVTATSRPLLEPDVAERERREELFRTEKKAKLEANFSRRNASTPIFSPQRLVEASSAGEVLGQVAWPAMLSNIAYRNYIDYRNRSDSNEACNYAVHLHPLTRLNAATNDTNSSRWEPWQIDGVGCKALDGLFYETFVYRDFSDGKMGIITHAIIAFRGTENYESQALEDWKANIGMALNIPPGQFRQVKDNLPGLIEKLKVDSPNVFIYTAGHSLGGSLAQLASYLSKDVQAAYAFNTSPVTGWTWLRQEQAKDPTVMPVQDPSIIRVIQEGEVLGILRTFSNAANSTVRRAGRVDVALDFPSSRDVLEKTKQTGLASSGIALHSITLLACNLAARVAEGAPGAFGFSKEMASALILEKDKKYTEEHGEKAEGLCEVGTTKLECEVAWTAGSAICRPPKNAPETRKLSP